MTDNSNRLPLRKTSDGEVIETRPVHVEEWLDSLPYMDFKKTSRILEQATAATNQRPLKPAVRMELVELYSRPYLYYIESRIKAGVRHTLQSADTMQSHIDALKGIAANLAYAAKLATEEGLKKKGLWRKPRPPLRAILFSMNYLSHVLVFAFHEYTPTPSNVWRDLHGLYDLAAGLDGETTELELPAGDMRHRTQSIAAAYKRILLTALADPYHLPFGAVWEIYEQLFDWTEHAVISGFGQRPDPVGQFVINLARDAAPIPYNKFNTSRGSDHHRLLDTTALTQHLDALLGQWQNTQPEELASLSPHHARLILGHLSRAWNLPAKRGTSRRESSGRLELAYGINAAWFYFNERQEFRPPPETDAGDGGEIVHEEDEDITPVHNYSLDSWTRLDQGRHGVSVMKQDQPAVAVRVGELITLMPEPDTETWSVAVVRWLMTLPGGSRRLGLEIISGSVRPAAIRACSGNDMERRYRQCLLVTDPDSGAPASLIVTKGLYGTRRELELYTGGEAVRIRAGDLLEVTVAFEHFTID